MKFKFYPLKRNGEYAKTPVYTDTLDKAFCRVYLLGDDYQDIRYGKIESLYEVYIRLLQKLEKDKKISSDQFSMIQLNIGNSSVSNDQLEKVLSLRLRTYQVNILNPAIHKMNGQIDEISKSYEEDHDKINYVAFQMRKDLDRYVNLVEKRNTLLSGKLMRLDNPNEDERWRTYSPIIDDIEAITTEEIWNLSTS